MRPSGRAAGQRRPVTLETQVNRYAEGSCLVAFGHTTLLCTASVEDRVPPFLRNTGKGWVTAEYGILPRATQPRGPRDAASGAPSGSQQEIGHASSTGNALQRRLNSIGGGRIKKKT